MINLNNNSKVWLVTGAAGFIGSNLVEALLKNNQTVVGIDNFITGKRDNLNLVQAEVTPEQWEFFKFIEGDIKDFEFCQAITKNVFYVLHQAAVGSVPRSIEDPMTSHKNNVDGTFNLFKACVENDVQRVVYASSSSVYGDDTSLPKIESQLGKPLSPYAATKLIDEIYANVFYKVYGLQTVGLRYFNVFGKRQDPLGAYAAVIPKWITAMIYNKDLHINGDGKTSRDFCYIENTVQANLKAALTTNKQVFGQAYNVSFGQQTTLNELYSFLKELILDRNPELKIKNAIYQDFRPGDVRHSLADKSQIIKDLNYEPEYDLKRGLNETMDWYLANLKE